MRSKDWTITINGKAADLAEIARIEDYLKAIGIKVESVTVSKSAWIDLWADADR